MTAPVLRVERFSVSLGPGGRRVPVVEDVSLRIAPGRILCVVGESGSGKSVFATSLMRLLPPETCAITADTAELGGQDLLRASETAMRRLRGSRMAMVFQEPMTSLNPVFPVGEQISETLRRHRGLSRRAAREGALAALRQVHVPAPERRLDAYPHELSGGLRQRVMIAMAIACDPTLLIADEPTTALDVTIQAQILSLFAELRARSGMGVLLITHDLGVVAEVADEVAVMYAGRIVEQAPAAALFADAQHPYTLALLAAMPSLDEARGRLEPIPGHMPSPGAAPPGCRFAPRCPFAAPPCRQTPAMRELSPGHRVACWRAPVEGLA